MFVYELSGCGFESSCSYREAYFEKLNIKEIRRNKSFWKIVRPYFSNKDDKPSKIALAESNIVIADEKKVAESMNKYFINITESLNLKTPTINTTVDIQSLTDSFHFKSVSLEDVKKEVLNLNLKKSSTCGTIPVTILKQTIVVYLQHSTNPINHTLQKLKQSEVIPVYKKFDLLEKENYKPVSLLPRISKITERIIYKQINTCTWKMKSQIM